MLTPMETRLLQALKDASGGDELFPAGEGPDTDGRLARLISRAEGLDVVKSVHLSAEGKRKRARLLEDMAFALQDVVDWWRGLYPSANDRPEDLPKWDRLVTEAMKGRASSRQADAAKVVPPRGKGRGGAPRLTR